MSQDTVQQVNLEIQQTITINPEAREFDTACKDSTRHIEETNTLIQDDKTKTDEFNQFQMAKLIGTHFS